MRVLVKGEWKSVEEFDGSSPVEEAVAYSKIAAARRAENLRGEYNSGTMSSVQTIGGDPRKARKNFRFGR